jgi:hypothetical protein
MEPAAPRTRCRVDRHPISHSTPANESGQGVSARGDSDCGWDPRTPTAIQLLASTLGVTRPTARTTAKACVNEMTRACLQKDKGASAS